MTVYTPTHGARDSECEEYYKYNVILFVNVYFEPNSMLRASTNKPLGRTCQTCSTLLAATSTLSSVLPAGMNVLQQMCRLFATKLIHI